MKPVLEVCTHSVESAVSAERGGAMPVSYTHLDVYKRQVGQ